MPSSAADLNFGFKVGAPMLSGFSYSFDDWRQAYRHSLSGENSFKFGPSVETTLPWKISVELSGLYQPVHYRSELTYWQSFGSMFTPPFNYRTEEWVETRNAHGRALEFPLLLKKQLTPRFFGDVGITFRHTEGTFDFTKFSPDTGSMTYSNGSDSRMHKGFVIGGGIVFPSQVARISPEIRYTRWSRPTYELSFFQSPNRVEFSVGIALNERR
jgi:hypothetical protein